MYSRRASLNDHSQVTSVAPPIGDVQTDFNYVTPNCMTNAPEGRNGPYMGDNMYSRRASLNDQSQVTSDAPPRGVVVPTNFNYVTPNCMTNGPEGRNGPYMGDELQLRNSQ